MDFPAEDKDLDSGLDFSEPDLDAITAESDGLEGVDLSEIPSDLDLDKGKSKIPQTQQNILKTRRDIEDYFERKRLRQELDYLEDDGK